MSILKTLDEQGILTITLNRPDKLNALNAEVLADLEKIFIEAKINTAVRAILITGAGKAFCAGADINQLAECNAQTGLKFALFGQKVFKYLEALGKPSLAAVNGYAFGGGCELAMAATFRFAAVEARFGQPEVKLGVIPGYGGTQRLARLVGKGRALDLCLSGRFISAEEAQLWGLVTGVFSAEELIIKSHEFLNNVLTMAPLALSSVMEVIDKGYDLPLEEALHLEALHFANLCASQDKSRGVHAFLEKKIAVFKGV